MLDEDFHLLLHGHFLHRLGVLRKDKDGAILSFYQQPGAMLQYLFTGGTLTMTEFFN